MYLCSYEALLNLDRRCCTVHSFIVYVINIFYLLNYQLQYYLSWMDLYVCYLVSNFSATLLLQADMSFLHNKNRRLHLWLCAFCFLRCAIEWSGCLLWVVSLVQTLNLWPYDVTYVWRDIGARTVAFWNVVCRSNAWMENHSSVKPKC